LWYCFAAFQPITGTCAEKHDTFLDTLRDGETPLVRFTGKQLIMGEVRRTQHTPLQQSRQCKDATC
jgi:glutamine synthetase type III